MEKQSSGNWKIWDQRPEYGKLHYKRAIGELDEMESSKAICEIVNRSYTPGARVLDVGCGAGHYLRSLQKRVDENIDYTGVDATESYIKLARKAFPQCNQFHVGDILQLPFKDASFDYVMCNNVLLHLPPPPVQAISELLRVAKRNVAIRTVFGERNYIIRELHSPEELGGGQVSQASLISSSGESKNFNFFNMYTEKYLRDIIQTIDSSVEVTIELDEYWREFDNREATHDVVGDKTALAATRILAGKQVAGNLLLDWRFVLMTKTKGRSAREL